jgi:hypothetical protein
MFTDIYVSIQASQVLQERWLTEAKPARPTGWPTRILRTLAGK